MIMKQYSLSACFAYVNVAIRRKLAVVAPCCSNASRGCGGCGDA